MKEQARFIQAMQSCRLCPRVCGVNRRKGRTGVCGAPMEIRAARAALHFWEEPCISGKRGSGAVFFCGCPLHCVYCQNRAISIGNTGKEMTALQLETVMLRLQQQGAHNINLVTPTQFVPQIILAVESAKTRGLQIPIVYNSSGYERTETLCMLDGMIDVFLPDMKYWTAESARRYSDAADYPDIVKKAIRQMVAQAGVCVFDAEGMIRSGVIVRHMVLPGKKEESKEILRYLHGEYGNGIYISIMSQYTPFADAKKYPELSRSVGKREYEAVLDFAIQIGIEHAFIQEGNAARESFVPTFDGEGL